MVVQNTAKYLEKNIGVWCFIWFFFNCFPIATLAYHILPSAVLSSAEAAACTLNLESLFKDDSSKVLS